MKLSIEIDTDSMSYAEREVCAKQLRSIAETVDTVPARVREVAETPYYAAESTGPETKPPDRKTFSRGLSVPHQADDLQRDIEDAYTEWRKKYGREFLIVSAPFYTEDQGSDEPVSTVHIAVEHFEGGELTPERKFLAKRGPTANPSEDEEQREATARAVDEAGIRQRTIADLIERVDKLEKEQTGFVRTLDSRMRERAESLLEEIRGVKSRLANVETTTATQGEKLRKLEPPDNLSVRVDRLEIFSEAHEKKLNKLDPPERTKTQGFTGA